ncbi:MAG: SDR family oxidoreductase [Nannocystis sp.]|uniref:SDR family oxidoreductase n=1 Tax=Nannocystis sp. TaxID=1962667 RepID=UPI0024283DD7|nr:SDR family oxidoreductase [Nannocystis sp.]MBK9753714.1 SDR family oxidoreductase [Nannocystis sp.]
MRVVVTGATGHVGSNLVRALLRRGDEVRVMVRGQQRSLEGLEVERVTGDVRDADSLRAAFAGAEIVYHLAAVISITGDPSGMVRAVNVDGTRRVAEAALAAGVRRLVHCSSVHAFDLYQAGRADGEAIDETWARVPDAASHFAYDRSKAAGERALREVVARGLDAVIVHPSGIVGPYDFGPSRMGRVLLGLYHRRLPSLVDGGFDFVDVRDVVAALMAAEEQGRTGESYLATGHFLGVPELARMAEQITGVRPPRLNAPIWLCRVGVPFAAAYGRVRRQEPLYTHESLAVLETKGRFSWAKAQRELGYSPRAMTETLRDTYAWFDAAGILRR